MERKDDMRIVDIDGNEITGQPDLTKGRYLPKEGDPDTLVYTEYTPEEIAEMMEAQANDPVTSLQLAVAGLYELIAGLQMGGMTV